MLDIIIILLLLVIFIIYKINTNKIEGFDNLNKCDLLNMNLNDLEILDRDPIYIKLLQKLIKENNPKISKQDYDIIINRFQFYKINSDNINYDNITKKILLDCKLLLNEYNISNSNSNSNINKNILNELYDNSLHKNIIKSFNTNFFNINNTILNKNIDDNNNKNIDDNNNKNKDKSDIIKLDINEEDIKKLDNIKLRYKNDMEDIKNKNYNNYYYDLNEQRINFDIKNQFINYFIDNNKC